MQVYTAPMITLLYEDSAKLKIMSPKNKKTNNDPQGTTQKTKPEPREHHYHRNDVK
jgi:hypothetical protein